MSTTQTTLPAPAAVKVTRPGIYRMSAEQYHADPVPGGSLSSSGARKLLPPSCPAHFQHEREHGQPTRKTFDLGTAAHKEVLGTGPELVLVDRPRWDTNEVKAQLTEIRQRGAIPLKRPEYEQVKEMAEALRQHPEASKLFEPGTGEPEVALFWEEAAQWADGPDGDPVVHIEKVRCRALVDWLRYPVAGRYELPDYKTCVSAAPDKVGRVIDEHGYHIQGAWYRRAVRQLGLAGDDCRFLLVMQEKTRPYLVTVVEPDRDAMRLGEMRMREALDIYAECTATGRWPGYSDGIVLGELPPWALRELDPEDR
ncbi:PD-(D/E)XK nuclease-like domain-containing protein [Actinoplanes sp. N902-109]|uniref:PD-(D/E)XK nuclease-like domain-containing protein n=1 Tax=Actinoplanes sp. (strain N902-109) TaxID=649831 RepID=UPI0003296555|nr:PD-(D/E)XK nuclease-like domain-containing protein [Actinoplanes sp. N902-109]AGL19527.1 GP60 protein [Actinoplanes sp. N902-109]